MTAEYPLTTAHQGFHLTWPAPTGSDRACVYAINIGQGSTDPTLGCVTAAVG